MWVRQNRRQLFQQKTWHRRTTSIAPIANKEIYQPLAQETSTGEGGPDEIMSVNGFQKVGLSWLLDEAAGEGTLV
jgi:hypothetical protein